MSRRRAGGWQCGPSLLLCALALSGGLACAPAAVMAGGTVCIDRPPQTQAERLLCEGVAQQSRDDYAGAMVTLLRAVEIEPHPPEVHLLLGVGYAHRDEYERAIDEYNQYLKAVPENPRGWSNRGAAYLRLGDLKAARADIDRAIELEPRDPSLRENRVAIARASADDETIIGECTWLLERFPARESWLWERGKALGRKERLAEALADFEQVVAMHPTATAYYNRGVTRQGLRQHAAAVEDFTQVLKLDPKADPAYLQRCLSHYKLGQFKQGLPDCDEYVRRRPTAQEGYYTRGILRSRLKDQDGAIADYMRVIELTKDPAGQSNAWYGVGLANERAGRLEEARDGYQRAVELDPMQNQAKESLRRLQKCGVGRGGIEKGTWCAAVRRPSGTSGP